MKTIVLHTFESPVKANMARVRLEAEGIPCFLANEHGSTVLPNYGIYGSGVQLVVNENEAKKAWSILTGKKEPDPIVCPKCSASSISYVERDFRARIKYLLLSIIVSLSRFGRSLRAYGVFGVFGLQMRYIEFGNPEGFYECNECKNRF
jgi:hypothetical protein